MAFTFQELKQLKNDIAAAAGISTAAAARVIGYYNGGGPALRPDIVTAMISGDLSGVAPALAALGLSPDNASPAAAPAAGDLQKGSAAMEPGTDNGSSKTGSASAGPDADNITDGVGDDLHADGFQNAPQRKKSTQAAKRPTKPKKTNTSPQAVPDLVQGAPGDLCKGDLVQGETVETHELPPGLYDDICAIIDGFAESHDIQDHQKIHPLQFAAACTLVGISIKKRGLLMDVEFNRTHGGNKYNPEKVLALLYLYEYVCGNYRQVAFSHNFPKFAGVSREWFNDYMQRDLTSSRVGLAQKAQEIQRASLVGAITSGGSATVGNIFLGKALAGLQETVTIQHVSAAAAPTVAALPVFGPDGALLEDKCQE